jgi:hypothetical protein
VAGGGAQALMSMVLAVSRATSRFLSARGCRLEHHPHVHVAFPPGPARGAMDDHTFFLLKAADENIRRSELKIEQYRIHVDSLVLSRRRVEALVLRAMLQEHARLLNYRKALLTEPSGELMN